MMTRNTYGDNRIPRSEAGRRLNHVPGKLLKRLRHAAENAIDRCNNKNHSRYWGWGGRGIKVLFSDWVEFVEYLLTVPGHDNLSLVLDRIDNDKHYEPGNIRYVTRSESQINRRENPNGQAYFVRAGFARSFKRLHDSGCTFEEIAGIYCVSAGTIRNSLLALSKEISN